MNDVTDSLNGEQNLKH